jgi:hypothetical protein
LITTILKENQILKGTNNIFENKDLTNSGATVKLLSPHPTFNPHQPAQAEEAAV